jgi:predicted transcriptional regulator of viral defense system
VKPKTIVSVLDSMTAAKGVAFTKANVRADFTTSGRAIRTLMEQVQAEYAEMPGLSVTLPQAQRLWAVDQSTCEEAFSRLISRGVLRRTTKGRFVRA